MDKKTLLSYVAPCSLLCYTCPGMKDGAISQCAAKLCRYLEGCYDFNEANLPEKYRSWLSDFSSFSRTLESYADSTCRGCRNGPTGTGCVPGCIVPSCVRERGIDFCAECPEFPCRRAEDSFRAMNETLARSWLSGNRRIAEIGAERYFEERREIPHYIGYKKK